MNFLQSSQSLSEQFSSHWQASTADSNLTLHGFRRFKTTHLISLRYLEAEIATLDHLIYQLGLSLDLEPSEADRLGLRHCKKDETIPSVDAAVTDELLQRLRRLLKEYDEAVISFSNIMSKDTFSLLDDEKQCAVRTDLSLYETFKTRLIRIDQASRTRQDPLQRSVHKLLRWRRYSRLSKSSDNTERGCQITAARQSSQNTALIADIIARSILATTTAVFLIGPLIILSQETRKSMQILVVSVCIVAFTCLVSVALRVSNVEMMIICAAYAAIISVFVSNSPTCK